GEDLPNLRTRAHRSAVKSQPVRVAHDDGHAELLNRVQRRHTTNLRQPNTAQMAVGDNPVRGDLVPLRGLLNPEPVEIQQIREVKPRYIADRWGILFDVCPWPLVMIAFKHLDRAVVNGPQRSQQALLSVLGILDDRAFELSACVLV